MRVVICEDLKIFRAVISGVLIRMGHTVVGQAKSGKECLALCREHYPDLVTLDWAMNDINGDECARIIRDEGLATDLLFVTSQGQAQVDKVVAEVRAYIVKKPFDDRKLIAAIKEIERGNESTRDGAQRSLDGDQ